MGFLRGGSLWLFRLAGVDVFLHWSWLLVAIFQVEYRTRLAQEGETWLPLYASGRWYWIEYLALFGVVLLHEFGHVFACRQAGGVADNIVLWPLGGATYAKAPPRPGAELWTAAGGPLVNLLLVPVLGALWYFAGRYDWEAINPDLPPFLMTLFWLNAGLLIFNLIPVFPIDGGRMLYALLWFFIGRAESLMVVSVLGMGFGGFLMLLGLLGRGLMLTLVAAFVFFSASAGFRQGRALARVLRGPRRPDAACPACRTSPLVGPYWTCDECGTRFDLFRDAGQCPGCGKLFRVTRCPECFQEHPISQWYDGNVKTGIAD